MSRFVKVHFDLPEQVEGFPPIAVETLNGNFLAEGIVELENTPFFVESVALGDKVRCVANPKGSGFNFLDVIDPSGNSAISILLLDETIKDKCIEFLEGKHCFWEYGEIGQFEMLAIGVFPDEDMQKITHYFEEKEAEGLVSYAVLCI